MAANIFSNISAATAAVTNRFVTSTNMKVGAYTIANSGVATWAGGFLVTLTHSTVAVGTDTLGTVVIVGTDMAGQAQTETLTPVADSTVTGTKIFRTVTSATGAGWVIAGGNDTLVIGNAAGAYLVAGSGQLHAVVLNNSVAATIVVATGRGTLATIPASAAAGLLYQYDATIEGYLKVTTTSTNDITVIHTTSLPTTYAMV
jgi:hypothetical protein